MARKLSYIPTPTRQAEPVEAGRSSFGGSVILVMLYLESVPRKSELSNMLRICALLPALLGHHYRETSTPSFIISIQCLCCKWNTCGGVHVVYETAARALQGKKVHIILEKPEKSRVAWFVLL